jgi:protein-tyrosine phosphatase
MSRSATILIAFLMKEYKLRFKEAFEMVAKKRKCVDPNEGFRKQLLEYEK